MFAQSGILWLATAIFPAVFALACIEVNGGAAELSWTLRDFEGKPISENNEPPCTVTNIEQIHLHWKAVTGDADTSLVPDDTAEFQCRDNRGVTKFTIPVGRQMLWIEPVCQDEAAAPGSYEVPPPIVRNVEEGTVTTLDALLIVADRDCTCPTSSSSCAAAPW
jgi:hypothetical protein